MEDLEGLLRDQDIPFQHEDNHVMCFPHITNICTTHIIEALTNTSLANAQTVFNTALPPRDPDDQGYGDTRTRNPIALSRSTVWAIRASGQ
jgi:hypothetical protein